MNGLLMAKINNINLNIVLLNNDGGGIFSYLPQKHLFEAYFERLFGTPTGLNFEYLTLLYDFTFKRFNTVADFTQEKLSHVNSHIYEMVTNRDDNMSQHQILYKKLSGILNVTL